MFGFHSHHRWGRGPCGHHFQGHHRGHPHRHPDEYQDEYHAMGRHRPHGGFGFGFGPRGWGDGPGGFGGPARKLGSADLQLLVLALLAEQPRHGYELIKALEERSGGFYVPSPGVIYPALSYLEEIGHAAVEVEGTKKRYSLTDEGRQHLERNRAAVDALLQQLQRAGERVSQLRAAMEGEDWGPNFGRREEHRHALHAAMHDLRAALRERLGFGREPDEAELQRVLSVLRQAADDIRQR
jgi:DNA-binding PadR family transcriptional regulator